MERLNKENDETSSSFHPFQFFRDLSFGAILLFIGMSCTTVSKLNITSVACQTIRNSRTDLQSSVPAGSSIAVYCDIAWGGELSVTVKNLTGNVMQIDQTQSFFVQSDHTSYSYYDPTISTTTNAASAQSGGSVGVNLGAIGSAVGVGGVAGSILNGVTVGGSSGSGTTVSNTTYHIQQPVISLAPGASIKLGRMFTIGGMGGALFEELEKLNSSHNDISIIDATPDSGIFSFGVTITYSTDEGASKQRLVSNYYTNNLLVRYVKKEGQVNDALRRILIASPEVLYQPWYFLYLPGDGAGYSMTVDEGLFDYQ